MPRGAKSEPSASTGDATAKAVKGLKTKTTTVGVNKIALKRKEGQKDGPKSIANGGEGSLDIAELEKKRNEFAEQLRKCEVQVSSTGAPS